MMDEILERLEVASGPDRDLDALIWAAIHDGYVERSGTGGPNAVWINDKGLVKHAVALGDGIWRERDLLGTVDRAPAYTASIDAAMSLVPEGFDWAVFRTNSGLTVHAWCGSREDVFAETPALALCCAALRARSSSMTTQVYEERG